MLVYMANRIPPPPKECSNFQSLTKMFITSKVMFQLTITEIKYQLTVYKQRNQHLDVELRYLFDEGTA